jgi:hypothetical protein
MTGREPYRLRKVVRREPLGASKRNGGKAFFAKRGMSDDAAFLREQARRCRRLARGIATPDVAETLEQMAHDYDARAAEMETRLDPPQP